MEYRSASSSGSVTTDGGGSAWFLEADDDFGAAAVAGSSPLFRSTGAFGLIIWFVVRGERASIMDIATLEFLRRSDQGSRDGYLR
ncbi:hypothetical protein F1880_007769 [Penicillium rolfsii]|nr:hypothetical protein F1880_007769 [Penicillium rolfsii]